jgi:hypothetical protein
MEDERSYQPRETKRNLSPSLTSDNIYRWPLPDAILFCLYLHLPTPSIARYFRLYGAHDDPSGSPLNGINTLKQKWVPRPFKSLYPPTPGVEMSYPRTLFPNGFPIEPNIWSLWFTLEWEQHIINTEPKFVDDFILLRLYFYAINFDSRLMQLGEIYLSTSLFGRPKFWPRNSSDTIIILDKMHQHNPKSTISAPPKEKKREDSIYFKQITFSK